MDAVANLRRLGRIARVLAAHGLSLLLGRHLARGSWLARRLPPAGLPGPERLRRAIEEVGGTFIKLGQMLALQPDVLPPEHCRALSDLLDRVSPFSFDEVEAIFREELGRGPADLFDAIDRRPIATASIGQVHVAFRGDRKYAVKVQRPAASREFASDVRLMKAAVALIRGLRLSRLEWLIEPVSELAAWTRDELDYRNEARAMARLRRSAGAWERIPEVDGPATTRRLLVAEFLDGVTVLDYLRAVEGGDETTLRRLRAWGFDSRAFARHLIDNFLRDAFVEGIYHADLHPANLMILPDNTVGYIDFGIIGVLSRHTRRHLVGLTLAYTRGDLDGIAAAFLEVTVKGPRFEARRFRAGLASLRNEWYEGRRSKLRKSFTLVMLDMLRLSHQADVWPERDVIKYIRSAIVIDGLIARFAPAFDTGAYLAEVCARHLAADVLERLLSRDGLLEWLAAGSRLLREAPGRALDAAAALWRRGE